MRKEFTKKNITLICEDTEDVKNLFFSINKASDKIKKFFSINEPNINVTVHLLYGREEMDKLKNKKTSPGFVGMYNKDNNTIYIFSRDVFEVVSIENEKPVHKKEEFEKILIHELTHLFLNLFLKKNLKPAWLNEGIAGYIAKQFYSPSYLLYRGIIPFKHIHTEEEWNNKSDYWQARSFVEFIVRKYRKAKLIKLIKKIDNEVYDNFVTTFKEIYGISFPIVMVEYQRFLLRKKVPQEEENSWKRLI